MKKILLTISALVIASVAFSQTKKEATLEQKPVQDPKKMPVRVISTKKESVKKGEPAQKTSTKSTNNTTPVRKVEATPARGEKKQK